MKPGVYNFFYDRGATTTRQIIWKDVEGEAISLTGYTARMRLYRDDVLLAELSSSGDDPAITISGEDVIIVTISATLSASFPDNVLNYQLDMLVGDSVVRILKGTLTPWTEDQP